MSNGVQMVLEAIKALKKCKGSSEHGIIKYLKEHYRIGWCTNLDEKLTRQLHKLTKFEKLVNIHNLFKLS